MGWHKGLRMSFMAQHSFSHLGEFLSLTPLEYIQLRFRLGFDMEESIVPSAEAFDEGIFRTWAGAEPRPLTTKEIVQHLEAFGFSEEMTCRRKISMLSSGQRCKLACGAAFWTRPH